MLELDNVVRCYQSGDELVRAVDGVSLSLRAGEMLALEGPSGSGKTTLLRLIAALLKPEQGVISFEGRDLGSLSQQEASDYLMRDVGFIYQRFHLQPRTSALDNVSIRLLLAGMSVSDAQTQAKTWLRRVGLENRTHRTPEQLSGGERQRIAIARALAGNPKLILADEPTGSLDSARSREMIELLRSIARDANAAILMVTHDSDVAALADRRCTLRDGKLVEEGRTIDPGAGDRRFGAQG